MVVLISVVYYSGWRGRVSEGERSREVAFRGGGGGGGGGGVRS